MIVPDRATFLSLAQQGNLIPVYRELLADRLTPVSAFERLTAPDPNGYAFLLESVVGGERIGRYSFLGCEPSLLFRSKGATVAVTEEGKTEISTLGAGEDPLTRLKALLG